METHRGSRYLHRADDGFLARLAQDARSRTASGYYAVEEGARGGGASLLGALSAEGRVPVIAEVKFRSPSEGVIAKRKDVVEIARAYQRGGAAAISVLTEPTNFGGRLEYLSQVRRAVKLPVLMKDVIVDEVQVRAGARAGADAVLLIAAVFRSGMADRSLEEMVGLCHREGAEVVVEVHDEEEFEQATGGEADVVGINNRDLRTLSVSLETSRRLLSLGPHSKPVICESGISGRGDVEALLGLGARGFLVGSALMRASDPVAALGELTRVGPR